jgi:2'-5' RNA ligase
MHVTIYFFGEVEPTRIPDLEGVIRKAVEGVESFTVSVQGISAFPRIEKARVIWYGIRNDGERLVKVYERVRENLRGTGIVRTIEERPYTPHLTAGRVRDRIERGLIEEIRSLQDVVFGSSLVSEMVLFKSVLTPRGAVYEKLALFEL